MPPSYNQPSNNQNTNDTEPEFSSSASNAFPPHAEPPTTSISSAPNPVVTEPRNLLAALLLTLAFGTTGLHQLYLGRKKQAWIRFGLLLGILPLYALMFIVPAIGIIAGILAFFIVPVLFIWGIIDLFKVYLKRVDGDGNTLQAGPRDTKAAKIVFWSTILINAVIPVLVVILTFSSIRSYNTVQDRARESMDRQNSLNELRMKNNELYQ